MKLKQAIIKTMNRDDLKEVVDSLEIATVDRRDRGSMAKSIGRRQNIDAKYLLDLLTETQIRDVCELLGEDVTGRKNALKKMLLRRHGKKMTAQIPVCLWFISRDKKNGLGGKGKKMRNRSGETLFIDARKLGTMIDRVHRELTEEDIYKIADTYHNWRGDRDGKYKDVPGFCKSAKTEEIQQHNHVLTPGRYVGAADVEDNGEPFEVKMPKLVAKLEEQFKESAGLEKAIKQNLKGLGFGM